MTEHKSKRGIIELRDAGQEVGTFTETIIEHIKTAAFLLHQTNIMKHTGQPFIASTAGMQNILRGDPEGQAARVGHLQMIRVQIKKDIAALGIGSMHQSVDQQLPDNFLIKGGYLAAIQSFGIVVPFYFFSLSIACNTCRT